MLLLIIIIMIMIIMMLLERRGRRVGSALWQKHTRTPSSAMTVRKALSKPV
jgi:hypothetical protein